MAGDPRPGGTLGASDTAALEAARDVLATLSAGRAALLQLAAAHLPYDRVVSLHRAAGHDDGGWLADANGMLERRLAVHARGAGLPASAPLPARVAIDARPAAEPRRPAAGGRAARPPSEVAPPQPAPAKAAAPKAAPAKAAPTKAAPAKAAPPPALEPEAPAATLAPEAHEGRPAEPTAWRLGSAEPTDVFADEEAAGVASPDRPPTADAASADPPTATAAPVSTAAPEPVVSESTRRASGPMGFALVGLDAELAFQMDALIDDEVPATASAPLPASADRAESGEFSYSGGAELTEEIVLNPVPVPADELLAADFEPLEALEEPPAEADFVEIDELLPVSTAGLDLPAPGAAPAPRIAVGDEPTPTLREGRIAGAAVAQVDVRAGGRTVVHEEDIEVAEPSGDFAALEFEEAGRAGSGFRVTFERAAPPSRPRASAPRLTDDSVGDHTNPRIVAPITALPPDEAQVQKLLETAQGHARRSEIQKAIQAFTDTLDTSPTLVAALIGRGRCHLELGDYSSAMSDFARAEDLAPDRPDAHVATGDLYFARREYKRAIEFYDLAVERDPNHAVARCRRGISYYYRKSYRQAFQDLERALALDPDIPNIRKYVHMAERKLQRDD